MLKSLCNFGRFVVLLFVFVFVICSVYGASMSKEDAKTVVMGWLKLSPKPLKSPMGKEILTVKEFKDNSGAVVYYIVSIKPEGYAVVSADDMIEPIIAFSPVGKYDANPQNPFYVLLEKDLPKRLEYVKDLEAKAKKQNVEFSAPKELQQARSKWQILKDSLLLKANVEMAVSSIDDVRVDVLVDSRWSQDTEGGNNCYNIYTPNNYVCGCVATAMAQLMRYHQHPTSGVGTASYTITVDGSSQSQSLRGGDGAGGAYDWANMVLDPDSSTTLTERQAIGALTADAGTSVGMSYASSGSGADTLEAADAFTNIFGYSNAIKGSDFGGELVGNGFNEMANPNLDAGLPVLLGITGSSGGHAIVCDGYGYNSSTLYHHLNMGWSGSSDAWYNLPDIGTVYNFDTVYKCVYNVFTSGAGEIVSGRVVDGSGTAQSGVTVTADDGSSTYTDTTDSKGIYALRVPSATSFTLSCTGATDKSVTTGTSVNNGAVGNLWGEDFTLGGGGGGGDTYNATIGSQININASEVSDVSTFNKKPKVYIIVDGKYKTLKVLKTTYPIDNIDCEWKKKCTSGQYSLYLVPKDKGIKYDPNLVTDDFNLEPPVITSGLATFTETIYTSKGTFYNTQLDLVGNYFGTKKPKVYYVDDNDGNTRRFKVETKKPMAGNEDNGSSSLTAICKKIPAGSSGVIYIETKIGQDTATLNTSATSTKSKVLKISR